MNISDLGKPKIIFTIDRQQQSYQIDVQHCSVTDMYYVLKSAILRIENGELIDETIEAYDTFGNKIFREEIIDLIQKIKEEFDEKYKKDFQN